MTFDVGNNLTGLALIFLFLKYLLPIVIGLALLIFGYLFLKNVYQKYYDPLEPLNNSWFIIAVAVILIVILISIG